MGHGGGTITWKSKSAILFTLVMVVSIFPAVEGVQTINTSNEINLNENTKFLEVNAASKQTKKLKKVKRFSKYKYKNVKSYKYKKYRYKKVKATYNYKKTSYKTNIGAKNVVITSEYVMATGRHSCAMKSDYNYHTRVFKNYNPSTTGGTLKFEQGDYYGYNKGSSPEGLWYDVNTDMDFCLVHGMSHDSKQVHLAPYNGVINGKKVVNGYFV